MIDVVGILFDNNTRIYYFSPAGMSFSPDLEVVVETERGTQLGKVVIENTKMKKDSLNLPLKQVLRIADEEDRKCQKNNTEDARSAVIEAKKIVDKYKLKMNIIDANFNLDKKQLLFHFIADSRIDFRELAKELAYIYKTRIELRQIGVRDKAKNIGGIGPCGRILCCTKFLYEFDSVSINMAKNQNIALNPTKINGACGRLLCCLTYENDLYTEFRKELPYVGDIVKTSIGTGKVISIDIINKSYRVDVPQNGIIAVEVENGSN